MERASRDLSKAASKSEAQEAASSVQRAMNAVRVKSCKSTLRGNTLRRDGVRRSIVVLGAILRYRPVRDGAIAVPRAPPDLAVAHEVGRARRPLFGAARRSRWRQFDRWSRRHRLPPTIGLPPFGLRACLWGPGSPICRACSVCGVRLAGSRLLVLHAAIVNSTRGPSMVERQDERQERPYILL